MGLLNFIDYYQIKLKKTYKTNSQNTQKINTETIINKEIIWNTLTNPLLDNL